MRTVRLPVRSLLYGGVVVILAIAGLALLSEAFATGGQAVYLANITAGSKSVLTAPSIVVTGSGRATAPAARAVAQLLIVRDTRPAPAAAATPATGDRDLLAAVTAAIQGAGVEQGAIRVVTSPSLISVCHGSTPCASARVDVAVGRPTLKGLNALVDAGGAAASEGGMTVQDVGVGYAVADCRPLQARAREAAIADARARAAAQAKVLGVALGTLMLSSEAAPTEPADAAGCAPVHGKSEDAWWTPGSVGLTVPPFDPLAAPEAAVDLQVTLAFAIRSDAGSSS